MLITGSSISSASFFPALGALRQGQTLLERSLERLSTGNRINRGADDPAGLIASENLRSMLAALDAESRSLERADLTVATADGALGEIESMLTEAEGLAVANQNDGLSAEERAANQMEIDSLVSSANRLAGSSTFAGRPLLDGTMTLDAAGDSLTIDAITVGDPGTGEDAAANLRAARQAITTERGRMGAFSRYTIGTRQNAVRTTIENVAAAESVIRDTDYASEVVNLSRATLLTSASLTALKVGMETRGRLVNLLG